MKFEKQTRHVVYVESEDIFRVTHDSLRIKVRKTENPCMFLVGVAASVAYWDAVDRRKHCLGCARTIKQAWIAGDRFLLDTDQARNAAELVADLADSKPDENDICAALVDLLNAIAEVQLGNTTPEDFNVLPDIQKALETCVGIPDYASWSDNSRRRRFIYEFPHKKRTVLVYTLMNLYFRLGPTPLLTSKQRQELLELERSEGIKGALAYMGACLDKIRYYRFS